MTDESSVVIAVDVGSTSARAARVRRARRPSRPGRASASPSRGRFPTMRSTARRRSGAPYAPPRAARSPRQASAPERVAGLAFDATCSLAAFDADGRPVTVSTTGRDEWNVVMWADHRAIAEAAGNHGDRPPCPRVCRRHDVAGNGASQAALAEAPFAAGVGALRSRAGPHRFSDLAREWPDRRVGLHDHVQVGLSQSRGTRVAIGLAGGHRAHGPACAGAPPATAFADWQRGRDAQRGRGRRARSHGAVRGWRRSHRRACGRTRIARRLRDRGSQLAPGDDRGNLHVPHGGVAGSSARPRRVGAVFRRDDPRALAERRRAVGDGRTARSHPRLACRGTRVGTASATSACSRASTSCSRWKGPRWCGTCSCCPTFTATARRSPIRCPAAPFMASRSTARSTRWRGSTTRPPSGLPSGRGTSSEALNANHYDIRKLHLTGGHVANPLLVRLYADATDCTVELPDEEDSVLLGTAAVAAAAAGLHGSLVDGGARHEAGRTAHRARGRDARPFRGSIPQVPAHARAAARAEGTRAGRLSGSVVRPIAPASNLWGNGDVHGTRAAGVASVCLRSFSIQNYG